MVELAGVEPASGQSVATPSTCLFADWFFECGMVQQQTFRTLAPVFHPLVETSHWAILHWLMRDGLCSRHQDESPVAWRADYVAQRLPKYLDLGGHGKLSVAD